MIRLLTAPLLALLLPPVYCFHVDSSPELARKTFIKRVQPPNYLQKHDQPAPRPYTSQDRTWRFPEPSQVRPAGDTTLASMQDEDRMWRAPHPTQVRHSSEMGTYLDNDRMWRKPNYEMARHDSRFPEPLRDDERFWWKTDTFHNLLLEEDDDNEQFVVVTSMPESSKTLFRRPSARLSRHPHSVDDGRQYDDEVVSTMTEDDRLGWLTENTHKLLSEQEGRSLDE